MVLGWSLAVLEVLDAGGVSAGTVPDESLGEVPLLLALEGGVAAAEAVAGVEGATAGSAGAVESVVAGEALEVEAEVEGEIVEDAGSVAPTVSVLEGLLDAALFVLLRLVLRDWVSCATRGSGSGAGLTAAGALPETSVSLTVVSLTGDELLASMTFDVDAPDARVDAFDAVATG